jgi:hypothetical protein
MGAAFVLMHVAAHHQRREADEGEAVARLVVLVGGAGEPGGDAARDAVGHLLDSHRQRHVVGPGGHRQRRGAHHRTARGAGRLDLPGLGRQQAGGVGQQGGEVLLAVDAAAQHVADVERVDAVDAGVVECRADRRRAELAQPQVPVLTDRGLPGADDEDVSHARRIFPRSRR